MVLWKQKQAFQSQKVSFGVEIGPFVVESFLSGQKGQSRLKGLDWRLGDAKRHAAPFRAFGGGHGPVSPPLLPPLGQDHSLHWATVPLFVTADRLPSAPASCCAVQHIFGRSMLLPSSDSNIH